MATDNLIKVTDRVHIAMNEDGSLFIGKFILGELDAVRLNKDELEAILSYYKEQ